MKDIAVMTGIELDQKAAEYGLRRIVESDADFKRRIVAEFASFRGLYLNIFPKLAEMNNHTHAVQSIPKVEPPSYYLTPFGNARVHADGSVMYHPRLEEHPNPRARREEKVRRENRALARLNQPYKYKFIYGGKEVEVKHFSPKENLTIPIPNGTVDYSKLEPRIAAAAMSELSQFDECEHSWREYVGLTQQYHYCTKCDQKKNS